MIDRMFNPEIYYQLAGEGAAGSASAAGSGSSTGYVKTKCFHFTANNTTAVELIAATYDVMVAAGYSAQCSKAEASRSGIIDATLMSAKGMLGLFVQVFQVTPTLVLMEIKKGKGDILEWNAAFNELVNKKLGHLISKHNPATQC